VVKSLDPPSAFPAVVAGAVVVLVVVGVVLGFAVVGVVLGFAVVGVVLEPVVVVVAPAAAAVVVVEDGADVVVVDGFVVCVVVVVELAFFDGVLDPHAAAISPPARTIVPRSHLIPVRPDTGSAASGVTRLNM
jgi:hypothetical protein